MTCIVMGSIDQVERNLDSMGDRSLMDALLTCFAAQHIFLHISLKLFIMCCFKLSIMGKSLLTITADFKDETLDLVAAFLGLCITAINIIVLWIKYEV